MLAFFILMMLAAVPACLALSVICSTVESLTARLVRRLMR